MCGKKVRITVLALLTFLCFSHSGFSQELRVEFFETKSHLKQGSEFLVSKASPEKKAIVAGLMINGLSIIELQENLKSKEASPSLKLLCAWQLASISARARLLSDKQQTNFTEGECQPFLEIIEQSVAPVPSSWKQILKGGEFLINDRFDPFTVDYEFPPTLYLDLEKEKLPFLETESHELLLASLKEIAEPILLAIEKTDTGEFLLIEDNAEAWGFYCAKVQNAKLVWLTRVEPYWIFPSGGMHKLDLVIGEKDQVVVFCALPGSLSINAFDSKDGKRTVCFSTTIGGIDGFVIQSDQTK